MKITNKQYAQSLFEATRKLGEKELSLELDNFVRILAAHGDIGRAEAILSEFEKVWQKEHGITEAKVVSADRLEAKTLSELKDYITSETGSAEVQLEHVVDKDLLAGFVLRFNDQILDGSAKNMIKNLKKELIK